MEPVRLTLLGPPGVHRDGEPAVFDTRKALALLAFLAVTGEAQSRERLAELLWPDSEPARARSSLRRTLSVTAAAVGPAFEVSRAAVRLDPARAWCDAVEFARLAAAPEPAGLQRAVGLYRGDFLAGFALRDSPAFEEWQLFVAEGLRRQLGTALGHLVAAGEQDEEPPRPRTLATARRWLALDPLHEPAHQALMRLSAAAGERSAALRQYRELVRVLDRELGVAPLPETTALYESIRTERTPPTPNAQDRPAPPRPRPPLVGQERVLAAMRASWAGVRGSGRVLALTGPPGSGRSRLAEELAATPPPPAPQKPPHPAVLLLRSHEEEVALGYGLVAELLRAVLRRAPALAARLAPAERDELARLVPALGAGSAAARQPLDRPGAQARLYQAVAATVAAFARGIGQGSAGPLLVVDDAHWTDPASAQLLAYLVRRLDDLPVALLLTWPPETGLPGSLSAALAAAEAAGRLDRFRPAPLDQKGVRELVAAAGPVPAGFDPAQLLAETRGLPLLVAAYAEAWRSAGAGPGEATPDPSLEGTLPTGLRELLGARVRRLPEAAAQVLAAAAVLGIRADSDLVRATSGRSDAEVADGLEAAVRAGLLVQTAEPADGPARPAAVAPAPRYEFPYAALRRVVEEQTSPVRRRLLHGRAADALSRRSAREPGAVRPAAIARHLRAAGRAEEAAEWSWRAAARNRELAAHDEALGHLRVALDAGYPPATAHTAIGEVLTVLGRYGEARAAFEQAAAAHDPRDPELAVVEHRLAELHHRLGDWELADAHLRAALDITADPVRRARVLADRALVAYRRGDAAADDASRKALAAAGAARDPAALAQAHNVAAMVAFAAGDLAAAGQELDESLRAAAALADPAVTAAALNNRARLEAESGDRDRALATAAEALRLGAAHGDRHRLAALHTNLADLLHAAGRRDEALDHLKAAAALFGALDASGRTRPEVWTLVEW